MKDKFFLPVIFITFWFINAPAFTDLIFKGRIDELDTFLSQAGWMDRTEQLKAFITCEYNREPEAPVTGGFASPILFAGPWYEYGLFREMDNPLGYDTGSSIAFEKSRLSLSASLSATDKWAVCLMPFATRTLSLFTLYNPGSTILAGGALSLPIGDEFCAELMFTGTSWMDNGNSADEWFLPFPEPAGDHIFHAGVKGFFRHKKFGLSGTCLYSFSNAVPPGYFFHTAVYSALSWMLLELSAGYCSENYRTTVGKAGNTEARGGVRTTITPVKEVEIILGADGDLPFISPFPGAYLESDYRYFTSLSHTAYITGCLQLTSGASYGVKGHFDTHGENEESQKYSANAGITAEPFEINCSLEYFTESGGARTVKLSTCTEIRAYPFLFSLSLASQWEKMLRHDFSFNMVFRAGDSRFYLKLFSEKPAGISSLFQNISLTAGFEVRMK